MGLGNTTFHGSHRPTCCLCGGEPRVTGIVASYHQGIIGNHRHCHQGWLIFRHLNDWKMKWPNQWSWRVCGALGFFNKRRIDGSCHVMLMHVDVAGRILNDHLRIIFESSSNHLRIILMVKLSCLIVWMLLKYPHTSSLRWAASMVLLALLIWSWMGCSEPFVRNIFPIFELEKSTKSLQKLPWFHRFH